MLGSWELKAVRVEVLHTGVKSVCGTGWRETPSRDTRAAELNLWSRDGSETPEAKPASETEGSWGPRKAGVCLEGGWAPGMVMLVGEGRRQRAECLCPGPVPVETTTSLWPEGARLLVWL